MKRTGYLLKILMVAALIAAVAAGYFLGAGMHSGHDHEHAGTGQGAAGDQKVQYTCGMHPFIIRDEPGLCPICGMQLTPLKPGTGGQAAPTTAQATGERKIKYWVAPMDPTYIRNEPGKSPMGMDLVPVYEDTVASGSVLTIDPVTSQNMGIRTTTVTRRDLARTVRTVGLVNYDESRQYSVNSKIDGWIERLYINETGQPVRKGQALLTIYSPELVSAQEEYLLALRNGRQLSGSNFPEIAGSGNRLIEAARNRLRYWDISEQQIDALEKSGKVTKTLTLYSPYSGIVTMKKVVQGMQIMKGEELLQVADLSRVWVNADIYEYELPWIKVGQVAKVELPFGADQQLTGKITYIYPYLENETRTVKARIEFANPGLLLKPQMYANVSIAAQDVRGTLAVPDNAVLNSGKGKTVFVALGDGKFAPHQVTTGVSSGDGFVQVLSGLQEGDQVVTSAQFMLDSESKLREAIQKMLDPQAPQAAAQASAPAAAKPAAEAPAGKKALDDLFK